VRHVGAAAGAPPAARLRRRSVANRGTGPAPEARPCGDPVATASRLEGDNPMLVTILIILAIIALALFILGAVRGRRTRL